MEALLHGGSLAIRIVAAAASLRPALRSLFPYASLDNLRFSKRTTYPFDPMPYIRTEIAGELYELRDADNAPLLVGSLDRVIAALVDLLTATVETLNLGTTPTRFAWR